MFEAAVVAWLVAFIGDGGMRGLTRAIFGSPQERALRAAMEAAVRPVIESSPAGARAGLADALRERFTEPPALVPDGRTPVRAGLAAAIRAQLALLADRSATMTGQSYLETNGIDPDAFIAAFTAAVLTSIHQVAVKDSSLSVLAAELHAGESHEAESAILTKVDLILNRVEKLRRAQGARAARPASPRDGRNSEDRAPEKLPPDAMERLLSSLLKIPSVINDNARNVIQDMLQAEEGAIPYHTVPRLQVIAWLQECPNREGGLGRLISVVRLAEGDSLAMRRLDETIIEIGDELGNGSPPDLLRDDP